MSLALFVPLGYAALTAINVLTLLVIRNLSRAKDGSPFYSHSALVSVPDLITNTEPTKRLDFTTFS